MDIKQLAAYMSKPEHFQYVNAAANADDKQKRIEKLKADFMRLNFSSVRFSADVSDVGNEEFSFLNDVEFNFADFNSKALAFSSYQDIKKLVVKHSVRDSIKKYLLQRNSVIAANKAKKAEKETLAKDKFVSHPSY